MIINDAVVLRNIKRIKEDYALQRVQYQLSHQPDTAIHSTVCLQDRRPEFGTKIAQMTLHIEEKVKVRAKDFGKCPHCHRELHLRFVLERME